MKNQVQWVLTTALLLGSTSFGTSSPLDTSKVDKHLSDALENQSSVPVSHEQNEVNRTRRSLITLTPSNTTKYYMTLKDLEMYLEPVDHVLIGEETPVYKASGMSSSPHGIHYELVQNAWPTSYKLYQDPVNKTTILEDGNGEIYFDGMIGNGSVSKRFRDVIEGRNDQRDSSDHFVVKISPSRPGRNEYFGYGAPQLPPQQPQRPQQLPSPKTESKEKTVYPEILLIVDYEIYRSHGENLQALTNYMTVFWNAVDLRFRAMMNPKIRLNIAGMIVVSDDEGAPYLTKHREGKDHLHASETFHAVGEYLHEDKRLNRSMYDLAVVMTGYNLCATKSDGCDTGIRGVTLAGGICHQDEDKAEDAVVVIEDHKGFDGVLIAVHEIAHLIGALHDGEDLNSELSAKNCDKNKGNIMADPQQYSSNAFLWSNCSINYMRDFIKRQGECLHNKPVVAKPIAKTLPGVLLSRDEQCKIIHGSKTIACNEYHEDECGKLYCREPGGKCVVSQTPAEGSACSDGGVCLKGECTHEKEENNEVTEKTRINDSRRPVLISSAKK